MVQYSERMRPDEAFKRGFYYGLGFWISGIFLNVAAGLLIIGAMMALGVIGSAIPRESTSQPEAQDTEYRPPVSAPARRR